MPMGTYLPAVNKEEWLAVSLRSAAPDDVAAQEVAALKVELFGDDLIDETEPGRVGQHDVRVDDLIRCRSPLRAVLRTVYLRCAPVPRRWEGAPADEGGGLVSDGRQGESLPGILSGHRRW